MNINVIIFDLGKVILDFDHIHICEALSNHSTFEPSEIYNRIFNSGLESKFDMGLISEEHFYLSVKKEIQFNIGKEKFKEIWENIFTLTPEITELISSLKNRYKLFCLSNTNTWHFNYCVQNFPVLNFFDGFILSYKVGKAKPDSFIFKEALKIAGALPEKCVYIDDIKEYVEAANALGLNGIHFRTVETLKKELTDMDVL